MHHSAGNTFKKFQGFVLFTVHAPYHLRLEFHEFQITHHLNHDNNQHNYYNSQE